MVLNRRRLENKFQQVFFVFWLTFFQAKFDICPGKICPGDICPYQEYLSCYWPDVDQTLKVGFWNLFLTDANHYGDICPVNICLGNICPYQEYLSCYWVNFDQTLKVGPKSLEPKNFCIQKFLVLKNKVPKNGWHLLKDGSKILPLKIGQNWVSNSWDIPNMDKCCLDKCHCESP